MSNKFALAALVVALQPLLSVAQPAGLMPTPMSAPVAPMAVSSMSVSPTPLKYRDPSLPLTISEMSEMAREKQLGEFLSKHGYTTLEPPRLARVDPSANARTTVTLRTLGVWGAEKPQAEIAVGGKVLVVSGGETLAPGVRVQSVTPGQVLVRVNRAGKRKSAFDDLRLIVGREVEVRL